MIRIKLNKSLTLEDTRMNNLTMLTVSKNTGVAIKSRKAAAFIKESKTDGLWTGDCFTNDDAEFFILYANECTPIIKLDQIVTIALRLIADGQTVFSVTEQMLQVDC